MHEQQATPGFLVYRLSMAWQAEVDRVVAPFGLTHAQYSVLASLRWITRSGDRPNQRELADHLGLDPIFVSKLVRTLEQHGLVVRSDHPTDRRAFALELTPAGLSTTTDAITVVAALQERLLAELGGVDAAATRRFTATLHTLLAATQPDRKDPP